MKKMALMMFLSSSFAAQAADNIKFHGTLISPPNCTISNGKTIEVAFGNVLINKIDGTRYMQDVPYEITCDSAVRDDSMAMTLTLSGSGTDFNQAAVSTSVQGLGIELRQGDKPFTLGSTITVNESARPVLKAVPVKKSGVALTEGDFDAAATLQVDYQ
ncbi:fimbrial minor subunit StfF [Citrobacter freundii]|uniref:fimbrial minor subunit StfF n=1 Tax=Citrobacter freundii TaxID=546 RepID=UPI0015E8F4B0|nr:fimbrial minor subunit StfF [Citrobacter freundii]QLR78162.1 fimbrial minor subunit StfF [Citrobacter freundii]